MKNLLLKLLIGSFAIVALNACSKQAEIISEDQNLDSRFVVDNPKLYGSITGTVVPWIKGTTVYAANSFFQSAVTTTDEFGRFRIELNSGTYFVYITYEQFGIPVTLILEGIDVKPQTNNELGNIYLEE